MSQYWNKTTSRLQPYVPGEQPQNKDYIKLNTNENPEPPSKQVLEAMHAAVDDGLNLYPDPQCGALKQAIAEHYNLPSECIFVGNGSDEVLAHIFAGLFDADKPLLCPDISYSFYPVYARLYDIELKQLPLNEHFEIQLDDYTGDNGGIVFANPNAPTSIELGRDKIEALLRRNQRSTVVIDEAYIDFGTQSCVELVTKYPNLLVVQTVSKSRSLAGLRVGFALGAAPLIEGLERIKNSFNSYPLDKIAQAGARAAFMETTVFKNRTEKLINIRNTAAKSLTALDFKVLDSATNFLFTRPNFMPAKELYLALKEAGVLVRHFDAPRIDKYLRITVGSQPEMNALMDAINTIKRTAA